MSVKKLITFCSTIFSTFFFHLLPPRCVLCGFIARGSTNLCNHCRECLPILSHHCPQCAAFLPTGHTLVCGSCLRSPPPFDRTFALFPYVSPIDQLIIQLKFKHQLSHAKLFSGLLLTSIQSWYANKPLPDLLIPVPLHPSRLRERGFNQAVEIARPIAKRLQIPLDLTGIKRIKPTLPQSHLRGKERYHNIKNAFAASRDYRGLSVAILDDVITTGQTIRALSKILRAKHASQIDVWCCARVDN